jgi:hypothetical protein
MFWKKRASAKDAVNCAPADTMERHSHLKYQGREPTSYELDLDMKFETALHAYRKKDYAVALPLFTELADAGHADGQHFLSNMYSDGLEVAADQRKSISLLLKSAEQENKKSVVSLWYGYLNGIGCPKDESKADFWHKKLREIDDSRKTPRDSKSTAYISCSDTSVGRSGLVDGLPNVLSLVECLAAEKRKDWALAFGGVSRLAEQGDAKALETLARYYSQGIGVFKDETRAFSCLKRAAELGLPSAQLALGHRCVGGLGASKDPRSAYFWWLLAAANGLSSATKDIERIEREFSEFERRSIQAEASQWWDARFE